MNIPHVTTTAAFVASFEQPAELDSRIAIISLILRREAARLSELESFGKRGKIMCSADVYRANPSKDVYVPHFEKIWRLCVIHDIH